MVSHCFNPDCLKPLHYLREGKIYVFDVLDPASTVSGEPTFSHRMEHFWLCGSCSQTLLMERTTNQDIRVVPKEVSLLAS